MGTIILIVLAAALYVAMLSTVSFSAGGGDAAMGAAIASFMFTVALWIVLALLITVAAVMGEMPRRIVITLRTQNSPIPTHERRGIRDNAYAAHTENASIGR